MVATDLDIAAPSDTFFQKPVPPAIEQDVPEELLTLKAPFKATASTPIDQMGSEMQARLAPAMEGQRKIYIPQTELDNILRVGDQTAMQSSLMGDITEAIKGLSDDVSNAGMSLTKASPEPPVIKAPAPELSLQRTWSLPDPQFA